MCAPPVFMREVIVLIAHGTVESLEDLPQFVAEIRHGRPAPPELIADLRARYERVGGSPLLRLTEALARQVEEASGVETRVAMRLWTPRLVDVVSDLGPSDTVILVPLAPFSVPIYERAARAALASAAAPPRLVVVPPFGQHRALIDAWAEGFSAALEERLEERGRMALVCSAHSLPRAVVTAGDLYEAEFRATAELVFARLAELKPAVARAETRVAFQSQGALEGAWLGPSLVETFRSLGNCEAVCVAPIGFLSDHIETLYDLDIEARAQAEELGLSWARAPALNLAPGLVETILDLVRRARSAGPIGSN